MHIEPVADPDIWCHPHCPFRPREIAGPGDLEIRLVALNDRDRQTRGQGDLDIIGSGPRMRAMGGKDRIEMKALRGLRTPDIFT